MRVGIEFSGENVGEDNYKIVNAKDCAVKSS